MSRHSLPTVAVTPFWRSLMADALDKLPGHEEFLGFAQEIGASLPPPARRIIEERERYGNRTTSHLPSSDS